MLGKKIDIQSVFEIISLQENFDGPLHYTERIGREVQYIEVSLGQPRRIKLSLPWYFISLAGYKLW
jgi:hypothetical protein